MKIPQTFALEQNTITALRELQVECTAKEGKPPSLSRLVEDILSERLSRTTIRNAH